MAGKGIHEHFGSPTGTPAWSSLEGPRYTKLRVKQFDEDLERGKKEALERRAVMREIERKRALRGSE